MLLVVVGGGEDLQFEGDTVDQRPRHVSPLGAHQADSSGKLVGR